MNKKELEVVINGELSGKRFKKKASSWYRQEQGALQVVDLQKSSYGLQFYINLCCVPEGMEVDGMPTPKEHKCPVRIRLTSAFPEHRNEIEEVFDLERNTISDSQRSERIALVLARMALPFLDYMKDGAALKRAIQHGIFKRGSINVKAQKHLGIEL